VVRDTLWPEVIILVGLILTVVFFGFHFWNLVLALAGGGCIWRRFEVADRRGTLERQQVRLRLRKDASQTKR
jgi:hypothetical protein